MDQVLELKLEDIRRDEDQPRKNFEHEPMKELKAAIKRWGQMQPLIVRKVNDDYVLVDGERRWRALQELSAEFPGQYTTAKVVHGSADDEHSAFRKARQLIVNGTAQDLTPAEKADTISTLQSADTDSNEQFGLTNGNLRLLKRLASAPDYVRCFGQPRTYSIPREDGKGRPEKRECKSLPLTHLNELIALDSSLRAWDSTQLKANKEHKAIAAKEVKKIGERAQRDECSRSKLKKACDKVLTSLDGEKRTRSTGTAAVLKSVKSIEQRLQKLFTDDDAEQDISELEEALQGIMRLLADRKSQSQTA